MKRLFLLIYISYAFNALGQIPNECNLPSIAIFDTFNLSNCPELVARDTTIFKSLLRIDTNLKGNQLKLVINNSNIYYKYVDTYLHYLFFHSGHSSTMIFFDKNMITSVMEADSCKVTQIYYDGSGRVTEEYYCEYDKPNCCYEKKYTKGALSSETYYQPFRYSSVKDSSVINRFQYRKAIPYKEASFDKTGKKGFERSIEYH